MAPGSSRPRSGSQSSNESWTDLTDAASALVQATPPKTAVKTVEGKKVRLKSIDPMLLASRTRAHMEDKSFEKGVCSAMDEAAKHVLNRTRRGLTSAEVADAAKLYRLMEIDGVRADRKERSSVLTSVTRALTTTDVLVSERISEALTEKESQVVNGAKAILLKGYVPHLKAGITNWLDHNIITPLAEGKTYTLMPNANVDPVELTTTGSDGSVDISHTFHMLPRLLEQDKNLYTHEQLHIVCTLTLAPVKDVPEKLNCVNKARVTLNTAFNQVATGVSWRPLDSNNPDSDSDDNEGL